MIKIIFFLFFKNIFLFFKKKMLFIIFSFYFHYKSHIKLKKFHFLKNKNKELIIFYKYLLFIKIV